MVQTDIALLGTWVPSGLHEDTPIVGCPTPASSSDLPRSLIGPMLFLRTSQGVVMADSDEEVPRRSRKSSWFWPAGVAATGLAGAALLLLRGCWHRKMSWPVRAQGVAYQVCIGCGVKRLFDENRFRSYGPFSYELADLIAWRKARTPQPPPDREVQRPAS